MSLYAPASSAAGEAINGFPNWEERVLLQWINRARVEPAAELASCATCADKACYTPMPPLPYTYPIARAARFHSDEMFKQAFFAHDSACALRNEIGTLYPDTCDGSAGCACAAASPGTSTFTRISRFGASGNGEIIAWGSADPATLFYVWLHEATSNPACTFNAENGHRWLILKNTSGAGPGQPSGSSYATVDFGSGGVLTKIASGIHHPRVSSAVTFWATWNDTAAPAESRLALDGQLYVMTRQRGSAASGAYAVSGVSITGGCKRYAFRFRDSTGQWARYPTSGTLGAGDRTTCTEWAQSPVRDFNLDGRTDLLWRNDSTGAVNVWTMNGATPSMATGLGGSADWSVAATGDFDGDGHSDMVWRHTSGVTVMWLMQGTTVVQSASIGTDPSWRVVESGDFDGDGRGDLVWRHDGGVTVIWRMNGVSRVGSAVLGSDPNWEIVGAGDFDGDAKLDLLWRHQPSGIVTVWLMQGTSPASSRAVSSDPAWVVDAIGDFDGDGRSDLVWRHAPAGTAVMWLFGPGAAIRSTAVLSGPTSWRIDFAGDLTGDGRADLVWRSPTSTYVLHGMNGGAVTSAATLAAGAGSTLLR